MEVLVVGGQKNWEGFGKEMANFGHISPIGQM